MYYMRVAHSLMYHDHSQTSKKNIRFGSVKAGGAHYNGYERALITYIDFIRAQGQVRPPSLQCKHSMLDKI